MGPDQYLYRNVSAETEDDTKDTEVAYWRKCNQIQTFFASENVEVTEVSVAKLKDLQHRVNTLLQYRAKFGDVAQDRVNDIAALDLPTGSGFFWGATDYDDRYWRQLEHTSEQLAYVLNTHSEGDTYEYFAWW